MNRAVDATDDNSNIPLVNLYQEKFKVDPWVLLLLETIREFMVDLVVCGHPSALWLIFKGMTRDIFGLKLKQSNIDLSFIEKGEK